MSCLGAAQSCGDTNYGTSTPRVMLGWWCWKADLPHVSCPHGCERQPLCLLQVLLHFRDWTAEGGKREQLEEVSMVLVYSLKLWKGRQEIGAWECSWASVTTIYSLAARGDPERSLGSERQTERSLLVSPPPLLHSVNESLCLLAGSSSPHFPRRSVPPKISFITNCH